MTETATPDIRRMHGFTLIELLIALVIVGILAGFAYSNYSRWIVQTRRSDATVFLATTANLLEKYMSRCNVYPGESAPANLTGPMPANCPPEPAGAGVGLSADRLSPGGHYIISLDVQNAGATYTLTAVPALVGQGGSGLMVGDSECTGFTLTSQGQRGVTAGSSLSASRCWKN